MTDLPSAKAESARKLAEALNLRLRYWDDEKKLHLAPEDIIEPFLEDSHAAGQREGERGGFIKGRDACIARINRLGLFIGDGDAIRAQVTTAMSELEPDND